MAKTDNAAEVGMHVFERAGLGVAPVRFTGLYEKVTKVGDHLMPGSSCDYCSAGLRFVCEVTDHNGKTFKVGSDCVAKTGDAGLLRAYKTSPALRKLNRAKAAAKADRVVAEWNALMADEANKARLEAVQVPGPRGTTQTLLASYEWIWSRCGAAGQARYLKALKAKLAEA